MPHVSNFIAYQLLAGPPHLESPLHVMYEALMVPGCSPGWDAEGGFKMPEGWRDLVRVSRERQVRTLAMIQASEGPMRLGLQHRLERMHFLSKHIQALADPANLTAIPYRGALQRLSTNSEICKLPPMERIESTFLLAIWETSKAIVRLAGQQPSDDPTAAGYLKHLPGIIEAATIHLEERGVIGDAFDRQMQANAEERLIRTMIEDALGPETPPPPAQGQAEADDGPRM